MAPLVAGVNHAWPAVAQATALKLKQGRRRNQVAELGVAVAAGVEVGALLGDERSHLSQRRPSVIVGARFDRMTEQAHQRGIALELGARGARDGWRRGIDGAGALASAVREVLDVDEFVAGRDERLRRLALAEPVDGQARFA